MFRFKNSNNFVYGGQEGEGAENGGGTWFTRFSPDGTMSSTMMEDHEYHWKVSFPSPLFLESLLSPFS